MKPAKYDTAIVKGTQWKKTFTWRAPDGSPRDNTGYSAVAKFQGFQEEGPLMATVSLGGVNGQVTVLLSAAQTTSIDWEMGEWWLNMQAPSEDPERLLYGAVNASD